MKLTLTLLTAITAFAPIDNLNFDFRGARLGMPLSDFQSISTFKRAKCNRHASTVSIDPITICELSGVYKLEPFSGPTVEEFNFVLDEQSQPRLAFVNIATGSQNAADTALSLNSKFGFVGSKSVIQVTNGFGAQFDKLSISWERPETQQRVVLTVPCHRTDDMCLEMTDVKLLTYQATQRRRANPGHPKDF